jgi:hypothetical protein
MCVSTPKVETPSQPPTMQTVNPDSNQAASRVADIRRRRQMLSRSVTRGEGAMQGTQAYPGLKTKTGS